MDSNVTTAPIRVVLIDDDPQWCALLKAQFEDESEIEYVGVAHYAEKALDLIQETSPDVVLMDLTLPDGDGIELVRSAREAGASARFVMLSGNDSVEAVMDSQQAGALGFVEKGAGYAGIRRAILVGR